MSLAGARILVDLTELTRGWRLTHAARFLPELAEARPDDSVIAVVPHEFAPRVETWGMAVIPASSSRSVARARRSADLVLRPLSAIPALTRSPQIVWDCQVETRVLGRPLEQLVPMLSRAVMTRSSLVIYPTAAARLAAEGLGVRAPGLVLRPPVRERATSQLERHPAPGNSNKLRILVPAESLAAQNLTLLPHVSHVLERHNISHHIFVSGRLSAQLASGTVTGGAIYDPDELSLLRDSIDAILVPALGVSCCIPLVEFERMGFPVAASATDVHSELHDRARLFNPASPRAAADALLAAVQDYSATIASSADTDWRVNTPAGYASAISAEIDRLIKAEEVPWSV